MLTALRSATLHLFRRRMTLRYPDVKLDLGPGYTYDPKKQVGAAGYKGRHILYIDKCTGCQLCAIACENIALCIDMVKVDGKQSAVNKKGLFPQINYGDCVFCGFCVDACPFYAIYMTPDYELAATDKRNLIFSPEALAIPPKRFANTVRLEVDERGAHHV